MAKKRSGPSKSQAIRDYYDANPKAKPKEVAEELGKQGVSVTPQFVSTIRSTSKKKKKGTGRRGRPPGTGRKTASTPRKSSASSNEVSVDSLVKAKKMVDQVGSVDEAKAALDALSKLMD